MTRLFPHQHLHSPLHHATRGQQPPHLPSLPTFLEGQWTGDEGSRCQGCCQHTHAGGQGAQTCWVCAAALGSAAVLHLPSPLPLLPAFNTICANCAILILSALSEAQLSHCFPGSGKTVGRHAAHRLLFLTHFLSKRSYRSRIKTRCVHKGCLLAETKPVTSGC